MRGYPKLKLDVKGHEWTVAILPKWRFERRFGASNLAFCDTEKRTLFFSKPSLTEEVLLHEMVHAYLSESCVDSAELTQKQTEEVAADLFSKYGARMIAQARELLSE